MLKSAGSASKFADRRALLVTQDGIARSGSIGKRRRPAGLEWPRVATEVRSPFTRPVISRLDTTGFHTAVVFG